MSDDPTTDAEGEHGRVDSPRAWERQPGESSAAWEAFRTYRDLGRERSLDEVDRRLYPPPAAPAQDRTSAAPPRRRGHISSWSRRHRWVERAAAWDGEVDRQGRVAHVEAVRAMNERHALAARRLQGRALEALQELPATDLAAADVLRYLVEACKLERLAVGEVTDRTESTGAPVVLEIVERLVPIRGDARATSSPVLDPAGGDAAPVTHRLVGVAPPDEQNDSADWELPDEPPPFLRPAGLHRHEQDGSGRR